MVGPWGLGWRRLEYDERSLTLTLVYLKECTQNRTEQTTLVLLLCSHSHSSARPAASLRRTSAHHHTQQAFVLLPAPLQPFDSHVCC